MPSGDDEVVAPDEEMDDFNDFQNDKVLDNAEGQRRYTDVPWVAFAVLLVLLNAYLAYQALSSEQLALVEHGMDWRGRICGEGDLADAPLKGWINPTYHNIDAGAVCLKSCPRPSNGGQVSEWGTIMCVCNPKMDSDVSNPLTVLGGICETKDAKKYGYAVLNSYSKKEEISSYVTYTDTHKSGQKVLPCSFQYATHEIMAMCLPALDPLSYSAIVHGQCGPQKDSASCQLHENLSYHLNASRQILQRMLADLHRCWFIILICCVCAVVFAFGVFYIIQDERGTPFLLWTNVVWLAALSIAASTNCEYFEQRSKFKPTLASQKTDEFSASTLNSISWFFGVGTPLMFLALLVFSYKSFELSDMKQLPGIDMIPGMTGNDDKNNVEPAHKDMKVATAAARTLVLAGKAISLIPTMLCSVLSQVAFTIVFMTYAYNVAFGLIADGTIVVDNVGVSHLIFTTSLTSVIFHYLFFIWVIYVVDSIVTVIGGGAVAVYVFAPTSDGMAESDDRIVPQFPLWHSFYTMGRFHIGTFVASATVLMLTWPVRILVDTVHWLRFGSGVNYSRWDAHKPNLDTNLGMLEHLYRRYVFTPMWGVEKRALIQTVLHGTPFGAATVAAHHLNKHYGKYMAVPLYASSVMMYTARNNVALCCTVIGSILINNEIAGVKVNDLQSTILPLVMIFLFGHVICWAFLCHLDAAVVTEMVGYAEAKLRLYTPGVPQLTVPKDLILLCEEAQVASSSPAEEAALVSTRIN